MSAKVFFLERFLYIIHYSAHQVNDFADPIHGCPDMKEREFVSGGIILDVKLWCVLIVVLFEYDAYKLQH